MTSATTEPPRSRGGHRAEGHGYGLILFASVLLVVAGCFNLIYGIAAIANSHVFTANAHYVFGNLRAWGWIDVASLLWVVNLGCIDLNPWYARCNDVDRPDWLLFDLDPVPGAGFRACSKTALIVRDALAALGDAALREDHRLIRGSRLCRDRARANPKAGLDPCQGAGGDAGRAASELLTAEYRIAARPRGRVLVDYNQNAWGRTLASIYSLRPKPRAPVSIP